MRYWSVGLCLLTAALLFGCSKEPSMFDKCLTQEMQNVASLSKTQLDSKFELYGMHYYDEATDKAFADWEEAYKTELAEYFEITMTSKGKEISIDNEIDALVWPKEFPKGNGFHFGMARIFSEQDEINRANCLNDDACKVVLAQYEKLDQKKSQISEQLSDDKRKFHASKLQRTLLSKLQDYFEKFTYREALIILPSNVHEKLLKSMLDRRQKLDDKGEFTIALFAYKYFSENDMLRPLFFDNCMFRSKPATCFGFIRPLVSV